MRAELWLRVIYARAWVRVKSVYNEPLWLAVNIAFPLLSSTAFALLYRSAGLAALSGFAILGGIMMAFWSNVLWSMASQFHWDKQVGLFDIYLVSPAPVTALLVGMSLGGIASTAPSAILVAAFGWTVFSPPFSPSWGTVILTFTLTLASLYAMGMLLSSLFLVYGREAEAVNEAISEPVSMLSGVYFPAIGGASPFPLAIQALASLIPLTIGMDALRRGVFTAEGLGTMVPNLTVLATMATLLLLAASKTLGALEGKGRKEGTLGVRLR